MFTLIIRLLVYLLRFDGGIGRCGRPLGAGLFFGGVTRLLCTGAGLSTLSGLSAFPGLPFASFAISLATLLAACAWRPMEPSCP